jgi:hypothetical protein
MCSAASPGRASGDAHIVAPRVQPRSGSCPFHRGARGSSNRVRERVPNRVLPLLRFLCSTPEPHRQSYPAHPKGTTFAPQKGPLDMETGQYPRPPVLAGTGHSHDR